jgi:hypothetical protein
MFLFNGKARSVVAGVSQFMQTGCQPQHEQDARVCTHGHRRVALFDPDQGHPSNPGALGHESHGNAAAAARMVDVRAELFERPFDRQW